MEATRPAAPMGWVICARPTNAVCYVPIRKIPPVATLEHMSVKAISTNDQAVQRSPPDGLRVAMPVSFSYFSYFRLNHQFDYLSDSNCGRMTGKPEVIVVIRRFH